jgi:hypothetical protein
MKTWATVVAVMLLSLGASAFAAGDLDTSRIDQLTGLKGALSKEEGVYKVTSPRTDIKIAVDGWTMPPFMGLTSWAAFKAGTHGAMVMGDMVLMQDEVNPAMTAAFDGGLDVTALHNHFFFDQPKVYFMHIGGEGDPEKLARAVRAVLDKVKGVRAASATPADNFGGGKLPPASSINAAPLQEILGNKGDARDGMFKATFGRTVKMHSVEAGKDMGVNTWAAFAGSDDNAVVDGDFAVKEDELQPVLRVLRQHGINIVAIHSHMTHEQPRILFLHYWGKGKAADLAKAIKAALDTQTK